MKVRLEEGLQLVITPESYVEQVALSKWADTVKGECALLVEAYAEQPLAPDVCPVCLGKKLVQTKNRGVINCASCNGTGQRR